MRIGPNHVSVADIDSVKLIYGQATPFHKTEWYNLFTEEGKGVIFNLRDKTMHAKRRQLVSGAFSLTSTRQLLPFIRAKALAVLRDVDQASRSGARLEVASLMRRFAGDVSLKLSLGIDERQVETGEWARVAISAAHSPACTHRGQLPARRRPCRPRLCRHSHTHSCLPPRASWPTPVTLLCRTSRPPSDGLAHRPGQHDNTKSCLTLLPALPVGRGRPKRDAGQDCRRPRCRDGHGDGL